MNQGWVAFGTRDTNERAYYDCGKGDHTRSGFAKPPLYPFWCGTGSFLAYWPGEIRRPKNDDRQYLCMHERDAGIP